MSLKITHFKSPKPRRPYSELKPRATFMTTDDDDDEVYLKIFDDGPGFTSVNLSRLEIFPFQDSTEVVPVECELQVIRPVRTKEVCLMLDQIKRVQKQLRVLDDWNIKYDDSGAYTREMTCHPEQKRGVVRSWGEGVQAEDYVLHELLHMAIRAVQAAKKG